MIAARAVTPSDAAALAQLFAAAGCSCFCRWWHFEGDDYAWQLRCAEDADANRAELERALGDDHDEARGIVAWHGPQAVGWLKLCAPSSVAKLYGRRVYRTLGCFDGDRSRTLVIGCMLVHPAFRRRGVATKLIESALTVAIERGADTVEALPRCSPSPMRDDELWMGPAATFEALGFERVDGPDPYPVLRKRRSDGGPR